MFSLRALLVGVGISGLGAAGLIHRTQLWASAFVGIVLCLLLYAMFRAWLVPAARAFWGPFAVTSAVYLGIVTLQPLVDLHYNLPTTQLVVYGLKELQDAREAVPAPPAGYGYSGGYGGTSRPVPPYGGPVSGYVNVLPPATVRYDKGVLFRMAITSTADEGFPAEARSFLWVAQCLWCIYLAAVAGVTCSWLVRRRESAIRP
jgi:hypothetical protein